MRRLRALAEGAYVLAVVLGGYVALVVLDRVERIRDAMEGG